MLLYSYKTDRNKAVSPHFKVREFHSKNDPCDSVIIDPRLVDLLENIRRLTGKPVHINSGYRSKEYNRTIKTLHRSLSIAKARRLTSGLKVSARRK